MKVEGLATEDRLSIFFLYTGNSLSWHFENLCYKISLQFCWTTQRMIECTGIMIEIAIEHLSGRQEYHQFDIPWYNEIVFDALFFFWFILFKLFGNVISIFPFWHQLHKRHHNYKSLVTSFKKYKHFYTLILDSFFVIDELWQTINSSIFFFSEEGFFILLSWCIHFLAFHKYR